MVTIKNDDRNVFILRLFWKPTLIFREGPFRGSNAHTKIHWLYSTMGHRSVHPCSGAESEVLWLRLSWQGKCGTIDLRL